MSDEPEFKTTGCECEHDWQVEGINLRRSTGILLCTVCGARRENVLLTKDQVWEFIREFIRDNVIT